MKIVDINNIVVELGGKRVVDGVTLSLDEADILGLVGEIGCGKTSLLNRHMASRTMNP